MVEIIINFFLCAFTRATSNRYDYNTAYAVGTRVYIIYTIYRVIIVIDNTRYQLLIIITSINSAINKISVCLRQTCRIKNANTVSDLQRQ